MPNNFHLEPITIQESYIGEKYSSKVCQEVLEATFDLYKRVGFYSPWGGYFVNDSNVIVGAAGFNGRPANNVVEISYYTFQEFEGKGIATLACQELIKIARNENPRLVICAKTEPKENASTGILRKNGFVYKKVVQDHEIGDAWLWEL